MLKKAPVLDPDTVTRLLQGIARDWVDELLDLQGTKIDPSTFAPMVKTASRVAMFLLLEENQKLTKSKAVKYLANYILFTAKHSKVWDTDENGQFEYFIQTKPLKIIQDLDKKLPL